MWSRDGPTYLVVCLSLLTISFWLPYTLPSVSFDIFSVFIWHFKMENSFLSTLTYTNISCFKPFFSCLFFLLYSLVFLTCPRLAGSHRPPSCEFVSLCNVCGCVCVWGVCISVYVCEWGVCCGCALCVFVCVLCV